MSKISLSVITLGEIDEIVRLWDAKDALSAIRQFVQDKPKNIFTPYLAYNAEPRPVWAILSVIRNRYKGFALCEEPYLDLEFWDSHTGFYGTCFTSKPRDCTRFHFFKGDEALAEKAKEALLNGASENDIKDMGLEYCGYSVFRPIHSNVVGRTALLFDERTTEELRRAGMGDLEDREGRPLLKAKQTCSAVLLNAKFTFDTAEFIQQDPQLGQCATASLWVAGNIAARKFGMRHVRFTSITKDAIAQRLPNIHTAYASADPNIGLSAAEIKTALAAMGSMYQSARDKKEEDLKRPAIRLTHFIYSYVESGLPVILCLDPCAPGTGHAVAAVGHFLPSRIDAGKIVRLKEATGQDKHERHAIVSTFIDSYYIHDDCNGPFNSIFFDISGTAERAVKARLGSDEAEPTEGEKKQTGYYLREAIVPVHFRVRHNAWDSLFHAIDEFNDTIDEPETAAVWKDPANIFLWRSFLISGADFKRSLTTGKRNYPKEFQSFYAQIHMPKYVWVHEFTFTSADDIGDCFPSGDVGRDIDGEFIVDATTAKNDLAIISARMAKDLWVYDTSEKVSSENDSSLPCFEHRYLKDTVTEKK